MFESFILGMVQGVAEWLPISSEAMIILVKNNFFPDGMAFSEMISFAIFLHLGTLLAVIVYYRTKIWKLLHQFFKYRSLGREDQQYINFIIITTAISGLIGIVLLRLVEHYDYLLANEITINYIVVIFLVITSGLLFISEKNTTITKVSLTTQRGFITGVFQGTAAIPGISRSGSTIAIMGLLKIDKERALELSFILSVPLVLLANVVLNYNHFIHITINHLIAVGSAFIFGIITIDILLRIARTLRFSYFVGFFAIVLLILTNMLS